MSEGITRADRDDWEDEEEPGVLRRTLDGRYVVPARYGGGLVVVSAESNYEIAIELRSDRHYAFVSAADLLNATLGAYRIARGGVGREELVEVRERAASTMSDLPDRTQTPAEIGGGTREEHGQSTTENESEN